MSGFVSLQSVYFKHCQQQMTILKPSKSLLVLVCWLPKFRVLSIRSSIPDFNVKLYVLPGVDSCAVGISRTD